MTQNRIERRLIAILSIDVVSYARHVEVDEEGAYQRLKFLREELINPIISRHSGRTVTFAGDGAMIELPSVVEAVTCAIALQQAMADRNANIDEIERMAFRMGINLGDVIIDDTGIHGHGVNVAALLERLADPGSIFISGSAYDQADGRVDCDFEYVGEKKLKNILRKERVYRVVIGGAETGVAHPSRQRSDLPRRHQGRIFLAHANEDKPQIRRLYKQLKSLGLEPWLDEVDLLPGQAWKEEIPKAIADAKVFLACLSSRSINKIGYVQTELRHALTAFSRHPPGSIYLIPVRLDECRIPDLSNPDLALGLKDIQWVDLFEEDGFDRLVLAIQRALAARSSPVPTAPHQNKPQSMQGVALPEHEFEASQKLDKAEPQLGEPDKRTGRSREQPNRDLRSIAFRSSGTRYSDLKNDLLGRPGIPSGVHRQAEGNRMGRVLSGGAGPGRCLGRWVLWSRSIWPGAGNLPHHRLCLWLFRLVDRLHPWRTWALDKPRSHAAVRESTW